jgi:hypothetical protein
MVLRHIKDNLYINAIRIYNRWIGGKTYGKNHLSVELGDMGEQPNKGGQPFAYGYYTRFVVFWKYFT